MRRLLLAVVTALLPVVASAQTQPQVQPFLSNPPQGLAPGSSPTFTGLTLSGLTQGSVLFAGAGGAVSQDNANFFWDATNHRLGIGTASPVTNVVINSANTGSTALFVQESSVSGTSSARFDLIAGGAGGRDWFLQTGNNASGLNGGFRIYDQTTNASRAFIDASGNFAIGVTSTPQALLHVGTTAATCRTYNSFTDINNGDWGYCGDWGVTPNVLTYGSNKNGTGVTRNLQFVVGGVVKQDYGVTTATTWSFVDPVRLSAGYTVAGLPAAGTAGRRAFVTDQLTTCAAAGAALTGGGTLKCPVFDNGASWVGD